MKSRRKRQGGRRRKREKSGNGGFPVNPSLESGRRIDEREICRRFHGSRPMPARIFPCSFNFLTRVSLWARLFSSSLSIYPYRWLSAKLSTSFSRKNRRIEVSIVKAH